ncbi:MAG: universal stress protein [Spirochaetes bacterium]|nr:universal stress protein [Spirochaetota bacterium]
MALKRVLIPIDFSHNSKNLVEYAKEFKDKFNSEIFFLHVLDKRTISQVPIDYMYPELNINLIDEKIFSDSLYKNAEFLIKKFKDDFDLNNNSYKFFIEWGIPYSKIIEFAEENMADLIIIGSHGTSGLKHLLLGSVVDYVVHHSKIPVLVVKVK